MSKISAQVIAHSTNEFGDELITYVVTFPRFILAEGKTHRVISGMLEEVSIGLNDEAMFSRNSASSRAIPFNKMVESVKNDPFIPIAWQKEHKGMQGTEYITEIPLIKLIERDWLSARDRAIESAENLTEFHVTKQIANRLLEPFMWHTVIITTGKEGLENFFNLRCPSYEVYVGPTEEDKVVARSWKDLMKAPYIGDWATDDVIERLKLNKGQAEIHMMALAEAMWDARNESTPMFLSAGMWHIPYREKIMEQFGISTLEPVDVLPSVPVIAMISSVMCARVSYTVTGTDLSEWTVAKYVTKALDLANANPLHASPFEHCAPAMNEEEYHAFTKTIPIDNETNDIKKVSSGWCRNFRGFIQLRHIIEQSKVSS